MRTLFFLLTAFMIFLPSAVRAEAVPQHVIKKCQDAVRKANPVKITYNYGDLKLDHSKSSMEVSKDCGGDAAGCFHGIDGCMWSYTIDGLQIGDYYCFFPKAQVNCDFRGVYIDVRNDYAGCNARAVLRHELQHFMIWKTAKDNMIKEMKIKGNEFAIQNAIVCKSSCGNYSADALSNELGKIQEKWRKISDINDKLLDDVDHDYDKEVNYKVCAPYSLEIISN